MTCKDCIHSGLCYKENDYDNFPNRCGDFISDKVLDERPQGEWKETGYETGALGITYRQTQCSNCGWEHALPRWWDFCPNCGAEMRKGGAECMDEDAKQASIPYTYNAPQHDWKCGYPDITRGKGDKK